MPARARRSRCPVACTLDVLGDRWSLLVVRDVMRGKRRYADFLESPEGIPTNILADRLKRLVAKGVIDPPLQPAPAALRVLADRERRGPAAGHAGDGGVGRSSRRRPDSAPHSPTDARERTQIGTLISSRPAPQPPRVERPRARMSPHRRPTYRAGVLAKAWLLRRLSPQQ